MPSAFTTLVVDDQPEIRALLADMLEVTGAACTLAASGVEALRALDAEQFDAVFLDIHLEDVSGLRLADTVRAQHADTAIVMVTGDGDADAVIEAMQLGAVDYLLKPFKQHDVSRALRAARRYVAQRRDLRRVPQLEIEVQNRTNEVMDLTGELNATREGCVEAVFRAMQQREPMLARHSERVSGWAKALAEILGLPPAEREVIGRAALLHELGKWCLPESVLHRAGRLTPAEAELVRRHPQIASDILRCVPGLDDLAEIVGAHEERIDGTGFPRGLQGREMPLGARILAVADALDTLSAEGSEARPECRHRALVELEREAGSRFDEQVVAAARALLAAGSDTAEDSSDLVADLTAEVCGRTIAASGRGV